MIAPFSSLIFLEIFIKTRYAMRDYPAGPWIEPV
jgi:hypothetical protein